MVEVNNGIQDLYPYPSWEDWKSSLIYFLKFNNLIEDQIPIEAEEILKSWYTIRRRYQRKDEGVDTEFVREKGGEILGALSDDKNNIEIIRKSIAFITSSTPRE